MKTIALLAAVAATACMPPRRVNVTFTSPAAAARTVVPGVAVAPLIDLRPAAQRAGHEPTISRYTGLALVYFAFGTGRTDGADQIDEHDVRITVNNVSGDVAHQLDAYVRAVVGAATGATPAPGTPADVTDLARAALARPDGITIVPILDQFDTYFMQSADSISGGASYQSGNQQVTTSGSSSGTARTPEYANLRLRLALFETRGGRIVKQATAYVATSASGAYGSDLEQVLRQGSELITTQLAGFLTP